MFRNSKEESVVVPENVSEKMKSDYQKKLTKPSYSHMGVLVMNYNFVNLKLTNLPLLSLAMREGLLKYGFLSFRSREWTEDGLSGTLKGYTEAFVRHVMGSMVDDGIDEDSGLPHLVKAMACVYIMLDAVVYMADKKVPTYFWVSSKASEDGTFLYISKLLDLVWNFDKTFSPEFVAADVLCNLIKCLDLECSELYEGKFGPEQIEGIEKKLIERYGKTS